MSQVSGASKEHAINTPLSAAILRKVKDIPAPQEVANSSAGIALKKAPGESPAATPGPVASAPTTVAAAASAAAPAASAVAVSQAVAAPVPAASAPLVAQAASAPSAAASAPVVPVQTWTVEVSDGALSRALKRWAVRANVPLVWEAPNDKPALFATYTGSFEEAITKVMAESKGSGYRVHACAHDNVVRILHASQPCKRL